MKRSAKDCTSSHKEECVLLDMVETLYDTSSAPEKRKQARDELSAAEQHWQHSVAQAHEFVKLSTFRAVHTKGRSTDDHHW